MALPTARRFAILEQLFQSIDARAERDRLLATLAQALRQAEGSHPLAKGRELRDTRDNYIAASSTYGTV
jgi:hypothetical protein